MPRTADRIMIEAESAQSPMPQNASFSNSQKSIPALSRNVLDRNGLSEVPAQMAGSAVIPAHNEAAVIRRCLDALFDGNGREAIEVIIVCNGCSDDTATVARGAGHPVQVIELPAASKASALRAGDAAARSFPRLYLDADVVLPGASARSILRHLASGAVAARPPIRYETDHASGLVRSYYRARSQMPAVLHSMWGAGIYGLSAAGRGRFDAFPDLGADDLWLDSQFHPTEIDIVVCDPVRVVVPRRSRDLLRTLRRTYRGKGQTRRHSGDLRRFRATTLGAVLDLTRLCVRSPRSALDSAVYASFALWARVLLAFARMQPTPHALTWERDETSRRDVE